MHGKEKETGVKKKVKKISKNLTQSHFKRIGDDTLSQRYSASPFFYLAGKAKHFYIAPPQHICYLLYVFKRRSFK